jgi:hypothetical protein
MFEILLEFREFDLKYVKYDFNYFGVLLICIFFFPLHVLSYSIYFFFFMWHFDFDDVDVRINIKQ